MLRDVNTGRAMVRFRQDTESGSGPREAIEAFLGSGRLNFVSTLAGVRLSAPGVDVLPALRLAFLDRPVEEVCASADLRDFAEFCIPEGSVFMPPDEDVLDDDDSDLYDHLKPLRASASTFTGETVDVALLDTGYFPHPEFYKRIKSAKSAVRDEDDVEDRNGHGTHCAGLIVGPRQGRDAYGIAPGASLHIVRILGEDGVGRDGDVLAGLLFAADVLKSRVIVLCCGVPDKNEYSRSTFEDTAKRVRNNHGVVIAPAGNRLEGDPDRVNYPANCPSVIAAGAVDRRLIDAGFSCIGSAMDPVEVTAPGVGVRSGWIDGMHRRASGTSMSAAITGGIAALLAQKLGGTGDLFNAVVKAQLGRAIRAPKD